MRTVRAVVQIAVLAAGFISFAHPPYAEAPTPPQTSQQPPVSDPKPPPTSPEPVERLGRDLFRIGNIRVDTAKKEISIAGKVNDVQVLEFIACTKGGFKAYESALELDTNAITFNLGLILIGLDRSNAVPPTRHFDPNPPQGDPVEIWVEWKEGTKPRRIRAEELVYNEETKRTLPEGPWVYTGSVFVKENNAYLADVDGALIGFVHTPSPILENPARVIGAYGANRLNPSLNLKGGTPVVLTVRSLKK